MAQAHELFDRSMMANARDAVRTSVDSVYWARFKYEGRTIVSDGTGSSYDGFLSGLHEDMRAYGYVGFFSSGRKIYAFITWIGPSVSPLKKAKVSTDKAFVKDAIKDFTKEILADRKSDLKLEKVKDILEKASGASYGTGQ